MNPKEIKDTRDSTQSVDHECPSRAASTWHVFPLSPWRPLRCCTGWNDHVDRNAVKVEGSEEFLSKVNYKLAFERDSKVRTLVSGSTSRPVVEVSRAEVSGT